MEIVRLLSLLERISSLSKAASDMGTRLRVPKFQFPFHHSLSCEGEAFQVRGRLFGSEYFSYLSQRDWAHCRYAFGALRSLWEFCISLGPIRTMEYVQACDRIEAWLDRREEGLRNFKQNLESPISRKLRKYQSRGLDPRFCIEVE